MRQGALRWPAVRAHAPPWRVRVVVNIHKNDGKSQIIINYVGNFSVASSKNTFSLRKSAIASHCNLDRARNAQLFSFTTQNCASL